MISIIGCGNLGKSILNGLLESGAYPADQIWATKRNPKTLASFTAKGVNISADNISSASQSEYIILGLKPYNIIPIIEEIKTVLDPKKHTIISLATGVTLEELANALPPGIPIFRAMPNTAADVREALTCLASDHTIEEDKENVKQIFDHFGESIFIDEHLMDAATILGACGTAFVLRFIRGMIQGGIEIGFDVQTATAIVNQTVKGAAQLLIDHHQHPEYEIDRVTTPMGCTITGLNEMEHNGFSSALIKGILSSFNKLS